MKNLLNKVTINGHFKLASGRHSDTYVNKNMIYCNPELFGDVIFEMISTLINIAPSIMGYGIDVITGPATGGYVLALPLALHFEKIFVYPDKQIDNIDGIDVINMQFRRGYDKVLKGKNVLIIEDVITRGTNIEPTINAVKENGGNVRFILALLSRGDYSPEFPHAFLVKEKIPSWSPETCPMCFKGIPLQDVA